MEGLGRDLGYAVRSFRRRPAFSAAVVATLALGLGLNTAVFAVVEALLWRPLPGVQAPSGLVQLYRAYPGERFGSLAVPDVLDLRERGGGFLEGVAGWTFATVSLTSQGEPRRVQGHLVSANYFDVLGVRPALVAALKGEDATGRRGARASRLLISVQAGLSLVLLVCAGLFLQSLRAAETMDKGFATQGRLVASIDPSLQGYSRSATDAFYQRLEGSLRGDARVKSVAFASVPPLGLDSTDRTLSVPGYTPRADERMSVHCASVTPAYFEALAIPLLRGRAFTSADAGDAAPVAMVNQRFAERYWPGREALGQIVRIGRGRPRDFTIVGVVPTGKYRSLGERPLPFIYFAHAQEWTPGTTILIHAAGTPESLAPALREQVRRIDPHLPLSGVASLEDSLGLALLPARVGGGVLAALGALGLALAAVGLHGVMATAVARRRREIGVRIALGAPPGRVASQVLREGLGLVARGAAIGLMGAFAAAHALRGVLYGDPPRGLVFAAVPALLLLVAAVASGLPARRAAAVDPLAALRQD
ncbi:MAG: ABC transporter permease [Vicinamibacteria bacterium]|nr:ABC transporter permease [Vicinamibacteria bacterium]